MAESNIDPSYPIDTVRVEKAKMRAQFQAAKEEIEDLMRKSTVQWQIAVGTLTL